MRSISVLPNFHANYPLLRSQCFQPFSFVLIVTSKTPNNMLIFLFLSLFVFTKLYLLPTIKYETVFLYGTSSFILSVIRLIIWVKLNNVLTILYILLSTLNDHSYVHCIKILIFLLFLPVSPILISQFLPFYLFLH